MSTVNVSHGLRSCDIPTFVEIHAALEMVGAPNFHGNVA